MKMNWNWNGLMKMCFMVEGRILNYLSNEIEQMKDESFTKRMR
ncbi:MAG: hypothetical protein ACLVJO_16945 [[Clostridium] scindens]